MLWARALLTGEPGRFGDQGGDGVGCPGLGTNCFDVPVGQAALRQQEGGKPSRPTLFLSVLPTLSKDQ